jgi:hypothetical protein
MKGFWCAASMHTAEVLFVLLEDEVVHERLAIDRRQLFDVFAVAGVAGD